MASVLGVDSSTQSVKAEVRNLATGELIASAKAAHGAPFGPGSQQHPADWWNSLVAAMEQLGGVRRDIVGVSVAGQQHGLVMLDESGEVLRPAKLWNDTTSASEAATLVAELGPDVWARRCGSVPLAAFTLSKLAWVVENEPELIPRIAHVMLPHDWLTFKLTGRIVTDRGDASGTAWFNPSTGSYDAELLALAGAGIGVDQLPIVLGPRESAGPLTAEAAAALGLDRGAIVGPGTGDNMGAALGLGLQPGDVAISLGTSGVAYAVSDSPTVDPSGAVAGFADATGRFLPLVCTLNATKVTDTVASWLGVTAAQLGELALAAPLAGGPELVPYFDGERTPNLPDAKGTLSGLDNSTTREELARAAHDGVLRGLLDGVDALRAAGAQVDGTVKLVGGGARSSGYQQRCADLHGAPIEVPVEDEVVAAGAAAQAAAIVGDEAPDDVARRWGLGLGTVVEPRR